MASEKQVEFIKRIHPMGRGKSLHFSRDIAAISNILQVEYVKIRPCDGGCMILPCTKEEGDAVFGRE